MLLCNGFFSCLIKIHPSQTTESVGFLGWGGFLTNSCKQSTWITDNVGPFQSMFICFPAEDEGVPVVLVCGPKNTGKSTFNRYLINLLLNR